MSPHRVVVGGRVGIYRNQDFDPDSAQFRSMDLSFLDLAGPLFVPINTEPPDRGFLSAR